MQSTLFQLLKDYKVVIPIIQRDYAQGRNTGKVPAIRQRFVSNLINSLKDEDKTLELDFIFGFSYDTENGLKKFVPLDGQQRLTTLYLLHWYIASIEKHSDEAKPLLLNFTYETRHSSKIFCEKLSKFHNINSTESVKKTLMNQHWFFSGWKDDPTISSMLTMLETLQNEINKAGLKDVWTKLTQEKPRIIFNLLPMEKLGLADELYIKMNSRGKELTDFEYFKSRFPEILNKHDAKIFNSKIDLEWSDLFWDMYKAKNEEYDIALVVDQAFLRFMKYLTDLLIAKKEIKILGQNNLIEIYQEVYSDPENVKLLFKTFDTLSIISQKEQSFFNEIFYIERSDYKPGKTRIFFQNAQTDLLTKCSSLYDPNQRNNPFSIGEQLLLYACIIHLTNDSPDFNRRIRKLRNLITNSEDTVRKENLVYLLKGVEKIILSDSIDEESKFNKRQIEEELEKDQFIQERVLFTDTLYKLEDNTLLQGSVAILDLNDEIDKYALAFENLFIPWSGIEKSLQYESISLALLTYGDYSQSYGNFRRFGNKNDSVWRELLTPSQRRSGYNTTKKILNKLLFTIIKNSVSNIDIPSFVESLKTNYLNEMDSDENKLKGWKYYFIKYPTFRKNEEGFYYWRDGKLQYECSMMRRQTFIGFNWSPFLYSLKEITDHSSLDNYNSPLVIEFATQEGSLQLYMNIVNNGFKITPFDYPESIAAYNYIINKNFLNNNGILAVKQDMDNNDIEDRIVLAKSFINEMSSHFAGIDFKAPCSDAQLQLHDQ